jgi:hypothetical protein
LRQHETKLKYYIIFTPDWMMTNSPKKEQENFDQQFFALCCEKKKKFQLEKLEEKMKDLKRTGDTNN